MFLGPNLVLNVGYQIRNAQAFKLSKSLWCQGWPRHYFDILLALSCLSFGLMMSLVGVHDFRRQQIQKTVDVFTPAMTINALPYVLVALLLCRKGSPTMMMKTLPPDSGLCSNSYIWFKNPSHHSCSCACTHLAS